MKDKSLLDKSAEYLAFGLRIRSFFALPFRAAPAPEGGSRAAADVTVGVGATPPRLPNPAAKRRLGKSAWEAAPGAFLMTVDNQARYFVTDGCSILVEPLGGGKRKLGAFLVRAPFAALLQQRGLTTLHAGAVKAEAGAALFAGRKGAGKSTLLGALVERGCALLSDVFTGVEANADGRFLALPAAACLRLPADSLEALGRRPQRFEKVHEGSAERLLPAARFCAEPMAVRAVYVLEAHLNADIEIRPVSWTQAQAELRWHTFQPVFLHGLGRQSEHLRIVDEMAAQVPVFQVGYPASPFRLDALAERIAGHLESEAAVHPPPSPPDSAAQKAGSWGSTPEEAVARPHNFVGALSGRGGLFERAKAVLWRRLAADPNDAEALLRLGDLHRRPKSFSGGHLLLHDEDGNAFTRIEPEDNSIVLFPSRCVHEVTTVECDPGDFGAGRFSLNGALRELRADSC